MNLSYNCSCSQVSLITREKLSHTMWQVKLSGSPGWVQVFHKLHFACKIPFSWPFFSPVVSASPCRTLSTVCLPGQRIDHSVDSQKLLCHSTFASFLWSQCSHTIIDIQCPYNPWKPLIVQPWMEHFSVQKSMTEPPPLRFCGPSCPGAQAHQHPGDCTVCAVCRKLLPSSCL